jgi:serine/threonine-protein kinase
MNKISSGKIGRYEIIRVLCRGCIGEVVLAEDETLRRKVTIKRRISPPVANDVDRFQLEVKAAALRHPNLPVVYEMGTHDDLPFIAMEFVEGESLETMVELKRELDLITKLKMIEQVCNALGHAHKNGVVYGDLTPESIIVQASGVVKVIDYGIAKVQEGNDLVGGVDARVDLLFAGVTLFKLLKGKDQCTAVEAEDSDRIVNIAEYSSDAALRDLPPMLAGIVRKSLAEDAESRYQTGEQFAEAINKVVKDLTDARVRELLKEAERLTAEQCFKPALDLLNEAVRLAPSNAAVRKRRKSLRAQDEKIRRAERIRQCIRRSADALLSSQFDESLSYLLDARNLDPNSEDIKARIQSVENERRRSEDRVRALAEAERAKALGDFGAALRLTAKALEEDPTNRELLALKAAVAMQMEMEARKGRLVELFDQAERDLATGNYEAVVSLLDEAAEIEPLSQRAEKLRWDLAKARELERRQAFIEDIEQHIRDCLKGDEYEKASGLVNRALDTFPDEVLLHRLKAEVEAEERKYDVRQVVDLVIAEVEELFAHSPLEAMSVLGKALDNMPEEARLIEYEFSLRQQMESRRSERPAGARF